MLHEIKSHSILWVGGTTFPHPLEWWSFVWLREIVRNTWFCVAHYTLNMQSPHFRDCALFYYRFVQWTIVVSPEHVHIEFVFLFDNKNTIIESQSINPQYRFRLENHRHYTSFSPDLAFDNHTISNEWVVLRFVCVWMVWEHCCHETSRSTNSAIHPIKITDIRESVHVVENPIVWWS